MENGYKYNSKKGKQCIISLETDENENNTIKINLDLNDENKTINYSSQYDLEFLNDKFSKVTKFSNILEFKQCLINNITNRDNKLFAINDIYEEVIFTTWALFPNDDSKKNSFKYFL